MNSCSARKPANRMQTNPEQSRKQFFTGNLMTKKVLVFGFGALLLSLALPAAWLPAFAQSEKPSKTLRQLQNKQLKLQEEFEREVSDGKAQLYELEARLEAFRKQASPEVARFKIADWKDDELLALYSLYLQTEMFAQAIEAGRAFLKAEPKFRGAEAIRSGIIRSLLELGQLEEAQKLLDELNQEMPENPFQVASRVGLIKEVVIQWRERGRYDVVLKQAPRGYGLRTRRNRFTDSEQRLSDVMLRDRLSLAAEFISAQERLGLKKEAEALHKIVLATEFEEQAVLRSFYEAELAAARLMFAPAPAIDAPRWINSEPIKLANLRGKVVLLDFWSMWCSQCTAAFPEWRELQKKYSAKGLEIIGVTRLYGRSDTVEGLTRDQELMALRNFLTKHQISYPIALGKMDDVTNDERFVVASLPTVVLIDRRGNIRHIKRGVGEYRKLERQIETLINEN